MNINAILSEDYQLLTNTMMLNREFHQVYAGDLLSIVMKSASKGCTLITVISNLNTIAVAVLLEIPAIIITENQTITQAMIDKANEESVAIFKTSLKTHEVIIDFKNRGLL